MQRKVNFFKTNHFFLKALINLVIVHFSVYTETIEDNNETSRQLAPSSNPSMNYYANGNIFHFIINNFPSSAQNPKPYSISLPTDFVQGNLQANYSVGDASYLSFSLPVIATSMTVTFDRSCILPILMVSLASKPSITFITQIPQEFVVLADQCGIPNINSATENSMVLVPLFGYNTFNAIQTNFYTQTLSISSKNGISPTAAIYCPFFSSPSSSNSLIFKISLSSKYIAPNSINIYSSDGSLKNNPIPITVNSGQTVVFLVFSSQKSLSFSKNSGLLVWAETESRLLKENKKSSQKYSNQIKNRKLDSLLSANTTTLNGITTLNFPGSSGCYVYIFNSLTITQTVELTFLSAVVSSFFISTTFVIIIVCVAAFLVILIILIVCIIKCRKSNVPKIVYQQRTLLINNQVVQQDINELDRQQIQNSGFKVEEIAPSFMKKSIIDLDLNYTEEKNSISQNTVLKLYSVQTTRRMTNKKENNVIEVYEERYR